MSNRPQGLESGTLPAARFVSAKPAELEPAQAPKRQAGPGIARRSQLAEFRNALERAHGVHFAGHDAMDAWTVAHWREFWAFFQAWCGAPLRMVGETQPVCVGDEVETARFFPGLRLNYARSLLSPAVAPDDAPALRACHADRPTERWTRAELREQVVRVSAVLAARGLGEGDRVVALMRNDAAAVIAALAVSSLGATLSTASPEMGVDAVLDRFSPLAPRLLVASVGAQAFDTGQHMPEKVAAIARGLPSIGLVLQLDEGELPAGSPWEVLRLADALASPMPAAAPEWPEFGFNQPLFIMFSSGTTGRPKCIVHGAGGSLLEHVKEHRLHTDLRPGDRLYFHTSCGWMMWNWQLSALASGVEIVTYDGPISSVERLWELVAQERVTVFGTSPAYLRMSEQAALVPGRQWDLGRVRAILSTGAVLHEPQYRWVREHVGPMPLQSISGGTDILGCFVLGHPDMPVTDGEAMCRSLGLDVQAWDAGHAVAGVGELVCINPFPSRPLGFFGDVDGARFHAAYFARNPGVWTHGDLIEFSARGGARLHGRCDGVLNVRGIKFAPGEVYRVLDDLGGVRDAMLVEQRPAEGEPRILALLVLAEGATLDRTRIARMRREIATRLSPAHVPDRFIAVPELPVTHSGKPSEAAARAVANGRRIENEAALRNPQCLEAIRVALAQEGGPGESADAGEDLQAKLCALWQSLLGVPGVSPHDNFFELGGNSLLAAQVLGRVREWTGRALPLGTLVQAPSIAQLVEVIEQGEAAQPASSLLVRMRPGVGHPLFLVHGLSGTIMECWRLVGALRTPRPVYGLQAQGIDGEQPPQTRVEDMARLYVEQMRSAQPAGPYAICGFSFGGVVALEIARQLREAGDAVDLACLLDPHLVQDLPWFTRLRLRMTRVVRKCAELPVHDGMAYFGGMLRRQFKALAVRTGLSKPVKPSDGLGMPPAQARVYDQLLAALATYRPAPYEGGPIVYVRARIGLEGYFDPMPVWRHVALGGLRVVQVPGAHLELVSAQAERVAAAIDEALVPARMDSAPGLGADFHPDPQPLTPNL